MVLDNADKYKSFYQFMCETGLRATDTYFLTTDSFKLVKGVMYIDIITRKKKKPLCVPISKTARRIVEKANKKLFPWALSDRARQDASYELKRCFGPRGAGVRYCKKHHITMHIFRHRFAMKKLAAGVPLEVIAQLMGHSFTRVTEIYARYLPDENLLRYTSL